MKNATPEWDPLTLPSQAGRTIVVTGGNAGIGYFVVEQLAAAGAHVVIASRSEEKARRAVAAVRERVGSADLDFVRVDLASLDSVRQAADELVARGRIDVLVNNAGMTSPTRERETTADGHELTVGGNFLGHFALTALVFPVIRPGGRVVGLGSLVAGTTRLEPDLYSEQSYKPARAYGFSKHAVHGFAFELDRRLRAAGDSRESLLAHPGWASDISTPRIFDSSSTPRLRLPVPQGKDRGAWPVVRAAIDPDAASGTFFAPDGMGQLFGKPHAITPPESSATPEFGAELWADAEKRSGIAFTVPSGPGATR